MSWKNWDKKKNIPYIPAYTRARGDVRRRPGRVGEESERQDRLLCSRLVVQENAEQHQPDGEGSDGERASPARGAGFDESEDDPGHADRRGQSADEIEAALAPVGLGDHDPTEKPRDNGDRDVHEHHPSP